MKAYKIFRKMKDGQLSPLFIDQKSRLPIGEWLDAKMDLTKKGFAVRPGWHCCFNPLAPHLNTTMKNGQQRVWCEIEVDDLIGVYKKPVSQGGEWILAKRIKIVKEISQRDVAEVLSMID